MQTILAARRSAAVRLAGLGAAFALALASIAVHAADPIKVGFSMPLTGPLASTGKAVLSAYQMWEEDTNAKGGLLGRKVQLVYYDDQSSPAGVPGIYTKLFDIDKIDLALTSYGTNLSAPSVPVASSRGYVLMGLFGLAVNEQFNYPWYFSMFPAGQDAVHEFSRGFFDIAAGLQPKPQTVAIVGADTDFAKKAADGAHDNALKAGFKIVYEKGYPPGTVNFTPILRAIQAVNPDVIYIASYPPDSAGMVRAASEIGIKARLFGGGMVGLQYATLKTQLGPMLNGITNYDFYVPEPTVPFQGMGDFLRRYQQKAAGQDYDQLGFFVPPFGYANVQVLGEAVKAVGSLDQKKLGEYIKSHSFNTIVGEIRYAPNGEWASPRVLQIQFQGIAGNGLDQFKKAGTQVIVYPKAFASGTVQTPYAAGGH